MVRQLLEQFVSVAFGDVVAKAEQGTDNASGQQQVVQRSSINRTIWYAMQ